MFYPRWDGDFSPPLLGYKIMVTSTLQMKILTLILTFIFLGLFTCLTSFR